MLKQISKKFILSSALTGMAAVFAMGAPAQAEDAAAGFSAAQKEEMGGVIREYLMEHPEVIFESIEAFRAKEEQARQAQAETAIQDNISKLTSGDSPFVGSKDADITVVEFFDYNCGYCKRALPDVQHALKEDPNVKVVFKEMPILGPTSLTASKWARAAQKQGKYFEFHVALMEYKGPKEEAELEKIAKSLGLDTKKMKEDANSAEVQKAIDADMALAHEIGINGTPAFVIGKTLYPGYLGEDGLLESIKKERAGGE